jgi:hypothetical protein
MQMFELAKIVKTILEEKSLIKKKRFSNVASIGLQLELIHNERSSCKGENNRLFRAGMSPS